MLVVQHNLARFELPANPPLIAAGVVPMITKNSNVCYDSWPNNNLKFESVRSTRFEVEPSDIENGAVWDCTPNMEDTVIYNGYSSPCSPCKCGKIKASTKHILTFVCLNDMRGPNLPLENNDKNKRKLRIWRHIVTWMRIAIAKSLNKARNV